MAVLKIVKNNYTSSNSNVPDGVDETLMTNITDWHKTKDNLILGYNVLLGTPVEMAAQFQTVRRIYHKETGRLIRHFIVSFSKSETDSPIFAFRFAQFIAMYYIKDYQIISAVHQDTENLHIHFVMNTVSLVDGHKFNEGPKELADFLVYLNSICPSNKFELES